uniref:Pentatricopeptide repeat-containing protein n=1 Tax=Kalanchoe fedtschenkoi TaxID=63787 RepID=A0A7N0U4T9_KALFE
MFMLNGARNVAQSSQILQKLALIIPVAFRNHRRSLASWVEADEIARIISEHPFPEKPLYPLLSQHIQPPALNNELAEDILGRLFASHSNGLKASEFFRFCLTHCQSSLSPDAFEKTLHILTRMRYFDKAWELMEKIGKSNPSLLTLKSMSIILARTAKFMSYEDTLEAFERLEKNIFIDRKFGTEEFNVLLRSFCTQRQMKEAKSVFVKMYNRFVPNTKTMNILLLGFKESGDITAVELFYHEMVRRGFKPNAITYGIRIDAYCKRGCFGDGLRLLEEMELANCPPTLETMTTLIHGAGVAKNASRARQLFDELPSRNLQPDVGAYNALMSSLIRAREVKSALALMDEMEEKQIGHDSSSYHAMFSGLMKTNDAEGVCEIYQGMIKRNFVPKTRTVVMLMKHFCQNQRLDMALSLWKYLIEKGYCPHSHALDLLVTGLCSRGRVLEAFECCKQILERGRHMNQPSYLMLKRFLLQGRQRERLNEIESLIKKLLRILPPPKGPSSAFQTTCGL